MKRAGHLFLVLNGMIWMHEKGKLQFVRFRSDFILNPTFPSSDWWIHIPQVWWTGRSNGTKLETSK